MKTCPHCKIQKPLSEFNKRTGRPGVKHICRVCYREASRTHYKNNKAAYKKRTRHNGAARRKMIRQIIAAVKNRPCPDCGNSYPHYVMDLDHLDPAAKKLTPARLAGSGWPLEKIEAEINKCEAVCSNCHRERTWGPAAKKSAAERRSALTTNPIGV